jgi:hypothetical protein
MSVMDRVLDALRTAVLLESRVTALASAVGDLAKELRDVDRRLVRVETVIEIGTKGGFSGSGPPRIDDQR